MRRLYSSTLDVRQGAVPRSFTTPTTCLDVGILPPIDPPGCYLWDVSTNSYGQLPKTWAGAVDYGDLYNDFLGDIVFTADAEWTDLWSELTTEQQDLLFEIGCYCGTEGIQTPTLLVGPLQFPPVNTLPFFWIPPAVNIPNKVSVTRPTNPVISIPGNCCTSNKSKVTMSVVGEEIQLSMEKEKEPKKKYRSSYTDIRALLQNGFPQYCCSLDECEAGQLVDKYFHFPRWLSDTYDPYGVPAEEPVGGVLSMTDLHYDRAKGQLAFGISMLKVHDGIIHDVVWDIGGKPSDSGDAHYEETDIGYTDWADAPDEPGVDLAYNTDWDGEDLIDVSTGPTGTVRGDVCANQCEEFSADMGIVGCVPGCDPGKHAAGGYALTSTHEKIAASEKAAIDDAITEANIALGEDADSCMVDLCYVKKQKDSEGGLWVAVAAIYCKV